MSQSLSNILVHIVFSTKHRQPTIYPDIQQGLYAYIIGVAKIHEVHVHKIGGVADHLHLLISLPRTLTISKFVEEIKKSSSKWMKKQRAEHALFAWQNGYGAFSIGQSNYEDLLNYIQNQKEHHTKISFQDEYRKILNKYLVEFDEKYVWD